MAQMTDLEAATAAIGAACKAVKSARDIEFRRFDEAALIDFTRDVERLNRLVFSIQLHLIDDLDHRGAATSRGYTSTTAMLKDVLTISAGEARSRLNAATAILPQKAASGADIDPKLPHLRTAVDNGSIGIDQTRIIETTMRKLPAETDPNLRDSCEEMLVEHGQLVEPKPFAVFARNITLICDPDGTPDREPANRVELSIGSRNHDTGLTRFTGHFDDEGMEILHQAIDAAAAPRATHGAGAGEPDLRSPAQRRGQALKEVLRRALDFGDNPTKGGARPHITLTMDFEDLKNKAASATLSHGGPITAAEARRLACDASIIPVVMGSDSQVLDVGRSSRTFPTAIRRAITVRDKGCTFPGCDRPPGWTDAHHVKEWFHDGVSSYENGCLLCRFHHTLIHKGDWRIQWAADGIPEFIPPPWLDPEQKPRRNIMHNTAALLDMRQESG